MTIFPEFLTISMIEQELGIIMQIRKAKAYDLNEIMEIYRIAQEFMIESGNPSQWGHSYPNDDLIMDDI